MLAPDEMMDNPKLRMIEGMPRLVRLAWFRTPPFHGGNTGSNPVRVATLWAHPHAGFVCALRALVLVLGTIIAVAAPALAQDHAIVAPFENRTSRPEFNWIGESFAIQLSDLLPTPNLVLISPDERRLVYQRLRLPTGALLSRAGAIHVAETVGANLLLLGSYEVTGTQGEERLRVLCRLVDLQEGKVVGTEFNVGGPLKELSELQGSLAWEILYSRDRNLPYSRQRLTSQAVAFPSTALEYFTKGIMTEDLATRAKLLSLARRGFGKTPTGPAYVRTTFELARALHDSGKYAESIPLLREVNSSSINHDEARFYLSVALYQTNKVDECLEILRSLERSLRLVEVTNNLAVVEVKKNMLAQALPQFSQAVAGAADDPDLRFNYAYALWLSGDYENAITQLRQLLRRRSTDGEAQYILAKALERTGRVPDAQTTLGQARRYLKNFSQWETTGKLPMLARIKTAIDRDLYYVLARGRAGQETDQRRLDRVRQIENGLRAAGEALQANRDEEALALLQKLIEIAPDSAEAHYLEARIYDRRADYRSAVNELRAAVFWDARHAAAHLLLAQIYLRLGDREQAAASLERTLQLDPNNPEALKLQSQLAGVPATPQ